MGEPHILYCPICGVRMARRPSGWYCYRGQTGIAQKVQDAIFEAMNRIPAEPLAHPPETGEHLFGYCARCGERFLTAAGARRVCPRCSLSLEGGIFYVLQELHNHRVVRGV